MLPDNAAANNVLLVEDNRLIREILTELLESEGYVVHVASHGGEGLAALAANVPFAVILLDWVMPVVGGLEFRRSQLGQPRWAQTPTLVLTADVHSVSKLEEARGATLVEKPLKIQTLLQLVHAGCRGA